MTKAWYENLRGIDWNFDYKRGKRFAIKGLMVELPVEVGDQFPQYFKKLKKNESVEVVMDVLPLSEVSHNKVEVVMDTETPSQISLDEDSGIVSAPEDRTLKELFESDLAQGNVKETKKFYTWQEKKISKEDYEKAENKEEYLFQMLN
ncbi:MAG: hypothetical protein PHR06_15495 [Candidatus Cloacimonetes bacterium]|nr:hypothetical protein [Candidatus Cloacimonadota bacterium]